MIGYVSGNEFEEEEAGGRAKCHYSVPIRFSVCLVSQLVPPACKCGHDRHQYHICHALFSAILPPSTLTLFWQLIPVHHNQLVFS